MKQKFIFTTLPWKDHRKNKWMLSLFVSIQLETQGKKTLADFPDILQWMQRLQEGDFFVQWNKNLPVPLEPRSSGWDPALYARLFEPSIPVGTFTLPDLSRIILKSYPVKHVSDYILNTYKNIGVLKPDALPKAGFFLKQYTNLQALSTVKLNQTQPKTDTSRQAKAEDFLGKNDESGKAVMNQLKRSKAIGFQPAANPSMDFGQFLLFHNRLKPKPVKPLKPIPKPEMEYHDILALLSSYPVMMRKLGLVIDFELPAAPPAATGHVRILPTGLGLEEDTAISSPATAFQYTGKGFYAASKAGSTLDKGHVTIGTPEFEVTQIDTDGAAIKLSTQTEALQVSMAKTLAEKSNFIVPFTKFMRVSPSQPTTNLNGSVTSEEDDDPDEGLPSLRSAGIGILRNGLAEQLLLKLSYNTQLWKNMVSTASLLNNAALMNSVLKTAPARPPAAPVLQLRKAINPQRLRELNVTLAKRELIPIPTEFLYADDLVFGYRLDIAYEEAPDQWYSLHQRKVSYQVKPVGKPGEPVSLAADEEIDEGCIHLALTEEEDDEEEKKVSEVIARWEGWSLAVPPVGKAINPFGKEVSTDEEERKKYQLGDDVPFRLEINIKPAPKTLPRLRFGKRYRLRIRTVDLAGNSVPHTVAPENPSLYVRGNIEYRRFEPLGTPELMQGDEITGGDRKMIRDRDGESLLHLVIRSNGTSDTKTYEQRNITTVLVDGQPSGTLQYHHEAVRFLTAPRTSQQLAETHGIFDSGIGSPQKALEWYQFINSRDKEYRDSGQTKDKVISLQTGQLDIDYLADPMAAGVVFTMLSDTSFETPWKKGQTRKFSFYYDEPVGPNNAGRSFSTEQWKQPRSVKIRLVEGFGEPTWENRVFTILLPKAAVVEISYGSFWAPEALEKFSALMPGMKLLNNGSKAAELAQNGQHWMFSPARTLRLVHAVEHPLERPSFVKGLARVQRSYNDTNADIFTLLKVHGASSEKLEIMASWSEPLDDLSKPEPGTLTFSDPVETIPIIYNDNILELIKTENTPNPRPDWLPPLTHSLGDTKYRKILYKPVATTRFREYFTGIIDTARLSGKEVNMRSEGEAVEFIIPSSARPVIPVVDYALPSFTWVRSQGGQNRVHLRTGNIRVYVRRPWFSSGEGERLAVIVPPAGQNPMRNASLKKYCTVWGLDPVMDPGQLNNSHYPAAEYFIGGDVIRDTVKLAEEDVTVSVVAYPVHFDKEKQLHYADIPIQAPNAYFPFIKLSLARYQQQSLRIEGTDCCLSQSAQTEWLQLVPERKSTLTLSGNKQSFTLRLEGRAGFRSSGRSRIRITIDRKTVETSDGLHISFSEGAGSSVLLERDFEVMPSQLSNGILQFSTTLQIPAGVSEYRVVVREFELHPGDPLGENAQGFRVAGRNTNPVAERLVFMDVFDVD